MTTLYLGV